MSQLNNIEKTVNFFSTKSLLTSYKTRIKKNDIANGTRFGFNKKINKSDKVIFVTKFAPGTYTLVSICIIKAFYLCVRTLLLLIKKSLVHNQFIASGKIRREITYDRLCVLLPCCIKRKESSFLHFEKSWAINDYVITKRRQLRKPVRNLIVNFLSREDFAIVAISSVQWR